MKKRKIWKVFNNLLTGLLLVLLVGVGILVLSTKVSGGEPEVFGYQLKTVLSGSMEPGIKTGSVIAVKLDGDMTRFKENDVITFKEEEDRLITHRVVEVVHSGENILYRTKGDNNDGVDRNPVLSENVVAEYTGITIPYIGYFINFTQTQNGAFLMLIPGVILLCYSIITIWKAVSAIESNERKGKNEREDEKNFSS